MWKSWRLSKGKTYSSRGAPPRDWLGTWPTFASVILVCIDQTLLLNVPSFFSTLTNVCVNMYVSLCIYTYVYTLRLLTVPLLVLRNMTKTRTFLMKWEVSWREGVWKWHVHPVPDAGHEASMVASACACYVSVTCFNVHGCVKIYKTFVLRILFQ